MLVIDKLVKTFTGEKARKDDENGEGRRKAAGVVRAVDEVSLEVREGEMFTLLGPSGCGKTTTLRCVAGLERPSSGEIQVAGRVLYSSANRQKVNIPPNRRGLGMVFQSYAIWPHMKVFDNAAFPLQVMSRKERLSKAKIRERVMRVLETLELDALANRPATKLSGGQQQRLALARALVIEPPLMLLDEPLSNLDAKLRESLRFELKRLQEELGITSVYVTHDQVEALTLSSRIAVMQDGKLMQVGTPLEIYKRPANKFVAEFIGTSNFVNGSVRSVDGDRVVVDSPVGILQVEAPEHAVSAGDAVIVAIRPEAIELSEEAPTGAHPNEVKCEVITRAFMGDAVDHLIRVADDELRVRGNPAISFDAGDAVTMRIAPERMNVIPVTG